MRRLRFPRSASTTVAASVGFGDVFRDWLYVVTRPLSESPVTTFTVPTITDGRPSFSGDNVHRCHLSPVPCPWRRSPMTTFHRRLAFTAGQHPWWSPPVPTYRGTFTTGVTRGAGRLRWRPSPVAAFPAAGLLRWRLFSRGGFHRRRCFTGAPFTGGGFHRGSAFTGGLVQWRSSPVPSFSSGLVRCRPSPLLDLGQKRGSRCRPHRCRP
jgi:hypothetical protein